MKRLLAVALVAAMLLGGCDYVDPDRMAIITGAAIDWTKDDGYELTVEVVKTEGSSLDEPIETQMFTATAPSLDLAEQELKTLCGAALYWGHAQALVLSGDAAKSAFEPIVDWVLRAGDLRLTVVIGVSGEEDAKTILSGEHSGSYAVGSALASAVRTSGFSARGAGSSAHRTVEAIESSGAALLPAFSLAAQDEERKYAVVDGGAVMVGGKLAGFMSDRRARDLLLLIGASDSYELVRSDSGDYGLELDELNTRMSAEISDEGDAVVTFALDGDCTIKYYDADAEHAEEREIQNMLDAAAELLAVRIADAIDAARTLGADTVDMTSALRPLVGADAANETALGCKVEVSVEIELANTGLIARSPLG